MVLLPLLDYTRQAAVLRGFGLSTWGLRHTGPDAAEQLVTSVAGLFSTGPSPNRWHGEWRVWVVCCAGGRRVQAPPRLDAAGWAGDIGGPRAAGEDAHAV